MAIRITFNLITVILISLGLLFIIFDSVSANAKDCVKWCDTEYESCVNEGKLVLIAYQTGGEPEVCMNILVAMRIPSDAEEYTPCHVNWENCENNCHMD